MCNRESFVLFPREYPIPVAWSHSYHHEEILHEYQLANPQIFIDLKNCTNYMQIECLGGDIHAWNWDNMPMIKKMIFDSKGSSTFMLDPVDTPVDMPVQYIKIQPDMPHWLEDNLKWYENKVESILTQLNPLRDKYDQLVRHLVEKFTFTVFPVPFMHQYQLDYDVDAVLRYAPKDSAEVKEFDEIINGFKTVPGFVSSLGFTFLQKPGWDSGWPK